MFRTFRTVIIGLLLGIALILAVVNFNSVKERITDLFDGFNQLPESFSLGDIFEGFDNTDTSIINSDGFIVKVMEGYSAVSYFHAKDNAANLTQVCSETIACINSGFFLDDGSHAGLLTVNGFKYVSLAPNDKQLTHVVRYQDNFLSFIPNSDYAFSSTSDFEFQSGPLFLENGNARSDLINSSPNGNLTTFRSFIGLTPENKIFIGVTTKQVDLVTLGNELKKLLGQNITVMNLDGGSSTAVYFRDSSLNSFGTSKILPNFIMFEE
jgi:exopolysaccharide biosynthesis protein